MKHTLLIAGVVTVFFASFLVFMDNALANHFESRAQQTENLEQLPGNRIQQDSIPSRLPAEEPTCIP